MADEEGSGQRRYFDWLMMYSTAAFTSASLAAPPLGGVGFFPFFTVGTPAGSARAISGAQAALSPIFGFIAIWQALHVLSNTALPSAAAACPPTMSAATVPAKIITRFMSPSFHVGIAF